MQRGTLKKAAAALLRGKADKGKGLVIALADGLQNQGILDHLQLGQRPPVGVGLIIGIASRQRGAEAELLLKGRTVVMGGAALPVDKRTGADAGDPPQELHLHPALRQQMHVPVLPRQNVPHFIKCPPFGIVHVRSPRAQCRHRVGGRDGAQGAAHLQR